METFVLLYGLSCAFVSLLGAGAWLADRRAAARRSAAAEPHSPVWVFNNMPAGALVDTERSVRESSKRSFA
ncbi:hypothetical protein [Usitatibacter palustris]|uniref:Uncharacterized protein n=1 Tax=Usitatibacter palustris TaxID=2732487 RepID=A0A6M4H1N8_9PROT|nr:hypothetical protein [Usitatibacter palustris]QJR13370.1 hypothetical protein DSM104440_00153 [Usitatibacter palustris]